MPVLAQKSEIKSASGDGLVDITLTNALRFLYEGPLNPQHLTRIELALRAFILCNSLSVFSSSERVVGRRLDRTLHTFGPKEYVWGNPLLTKPFGIVELDNEFSDRHLPGPLVDWEWAESNPDIGIVLKIKNELTEQAKGLLSKKIHSITEARSLLSSWYGSDLTHTLEVISTNELVSEAFPDIVAQLIERDTTFLLDCYRSRYAIFSSGPVFDACESEIFSRLPALLLDDADKKYRELSRTFRPPGLAVDLPLLTTLVLSRASRRRDIPITIVELRAQYQMSRQELWNQIEKIWEAETFRQQKRLYEQLKVASENLFDAAFPKRKKVMAVGLQLVLSPLVPSAGVTGAKEMIQQIAPQWRVGAMSFAKQLSDDLHRDLVNQSVLLRRHLTSAELVQFGLT
jgi:hypothetical protein